MLKQRWSTHSRVTPIMINRLFKAIIARDDPFEFESS
jgi:hypothetical protein